MSDENKRGEKLTRSMCVKVEVGSYRLKSNHLYPIFAKPFSQCCYYFIIVVVFLFFLFQGATSCWAKPSHGSDGAVRYVYNRQKCTVLSCLQAKSPPKLYLSVPSSFLSLSQVCHIISTELCSFPTVPVVELIQRSPLTVGGQATGLIFHRHPTTLNKSPSQSVRSASSLSHLFHPRHPLNIYLHLLPLLSSMRTSSPSSPKTGPQIPPLPPYLVF